MPLSIAPCGLANLTSDRYARWQGSLYLDALRGRALVRLTLEGDWVTWEERLFDGEGPVRDVRQGPDDWLHPLIGGNDGRVMRVRPRGGCCGRRIGETGVRL